MANDFPAFQKLPPEIRHYIWRMALTAQWSFTTFHRVNKSIKAVGKFHNRAVSQACHEARQIMHSTHTKVDGLGWFDFTRHLFFFRDIESSRGSLVQQIAYNYNLYPYIQHIVLNPRSQAHLMDAACFIADRCNLLRTIVIIGPWFIPTATDQYDPDEDWLDPYEDWSDVTVKSLIELDLQPLLDAIEYRGSENDAWISWYLSRLDQAVRRLPTPLPEHLELDDNVSWRIQNTLEQLQLLFGGSYNISPRLYLRTVAQMRSPSQNTIQERIEDIDPGSVA
ncbi:hypothetical protein PHISCL_09342 [Aspergillus sclerotialis]|uniref:2EXR domain-containing protein n=1 Tax=Aspergillus sclerotialis TaxID=2070753 RepID=A0A3A2ZKB6_9EURO|nr:hypothetical protein PHISCL_09342 [Aspergillus sclerotialis]